MRKVESFLNGLVKKETLVFFSRQLDHIEIVETTTLFGFWHVKDVTREVYIPAIKEVEKGQLQVIADAYLELHESLLILKEEFE